MNLRTMNGKQGAGGADAGVEKLGRGGYDVVWLILIDRRAAVLFVFVHSCSMRVLALFLPSPLPNLVLR